MTPKCLSSGCLSRSPYSSSWLAASGRSPLACVPQLYAPQGQRNSDDTEASPSANSAVFSVKAWAEPLSGALSHSLGAPCPRKPLGPRGCAQWHVRDPPAMSPCPPCGLT